MCLTYPANIERNSSLDALKSMIVYDGYKKIIKQADSNVPGERKMRK